VAFDRAATVRNAEKLVRQGKLDAGITEYLRVIEDAPGDWNVKNTLGDLYARAGQVDKAVEQFIEIANNLNEEGAVARASAVYKKILKIKPDHERTLLQLSEILGSQRLFVDARAHLNTVMELRRGRGDTRGALEAKVRLGTLDPEDYTGRMMAVGARTEMGDKAGAFHDLKEIAGELADKGRAAEAIDVLREAAKLNPSDDEIREKILEVCLAAGDPVQARGCATTIEQFRMVAAAFEEQSNPGEALETLRQAAKQHPDEKDLAIELARTFIARGDMVTAGEYLTLEAAGDDLELQLTLANIHLRGEKIEEGLAIIRRLLEEDPSRREQIAVLGWNVAEQRPEAGFSVVELAADTAVAQVDWPGAAAVLQEFVTRLPNHVPALMRLVEICVDGGLEATMYTAQAQLADAYIAAGAVAEGRFIAEDLVAREPWDRSNIERFRRALVLLGEPDPDELIAQRLSGESPFTSTDLFGSLDVPPPEPEPPPPSEEELAALLAAANAADDLAKKQKSIRKRALEDTGTHFELSANAIDLDSILGDFDAPPPPSPPRTSEDAEVDLTVVLDDIKPASHSASGADADDLDGLMGKLRSQAKSRPMDEFEKEYKRGLALHASGDIDGCIKSLEKASGSPRLRFAAAWLIGRLNRERGMLPQALEWLERASHASAPNADDAHRLSFELADALENVGEVARALAVCLELQADAGDYEDIVARIDRLAKVQARG
jgi:tetratricopeptide (TPR) repeat protein